MRFKQEAKNQSQNPSFSSSLLDEIYRSISEPDSNNDDLKFYRDTMPKSQIRSTRNTQQNTKFRRVPDDDAVFFSSTSASSDSSSGGFSSSDNDSFYRPKSNSKPAVSAPVSRPKPVKTRAPKTEALFYENRELHMFGDYRYDSAVTDETPRINESIFKSKSRALKIYNNLKKVKQPISPGGKLANFINSIFAKSKSPSPFEDERRFKSAQTSTCSSASSFSRSCLSRPDKIRDGAKRSVRFYPVSVIADEDLRPCGQKSLYKEEEPELMSVSLPTAWKIGKSPTKKSESELKYRVMDKSRRVEDVARDLLREYRKKNVRSLVEEENEEFDDAASDSSSDLFELENFAMIGKDRYGEELPVYETTDFSANRAIAKGLRY